MDDMNNNNKNFGEESFSEQNGEQQSRPDPYTQSAAPQPDPYTRPADPQPNPYANSAYRQPDPYAQQNYDPYAPQNGGYSGYDRGGVQQMTYPTGMATASLVIGIISIMGVMLMFMFPPLFVLPIVGIVLGAIYKSKHYPVGRGMSTAGIVTSAVSLAIALIIFILALALVISMMEGGGMSELMQFVKDYSPEVYEQYYDMYYEQYPEWFEGVSALFANIAAFFGK